MMLGMVEGYATPSKPLCSMLPSILHQTNHVETTITSHRHLDWLQQGAHLQQLCNMHADDEAR